MKKLGLRAVAGGLAVLMAVAGFAPATANAADVLTAKASKTLVITADMVDDDGEIVISNENWDRIIVEKEVNAKDIYFDGVEVGELVVESGGESNIQLWDVEAEQVTVKEPELVNLDINEIRTLYADKETKAQAFELYMKTREDNKNTLTKVPSIVTMEDAVVESLSVSGSVDLNVAQGAVKAVTLEANAAVSQMNVTLNGYDGDVAYKGTEGFSVLNLNSVNCAIENLTVEGSATNNYLNVESKNSTTANVEVAGNAGLSLNIPIAKLDVVAGATAAQVSVLSTVDELNVTASNASVNVGADAKVAAATIVGDKVSMSGEGKLAKVDITGKDASVSTSGTGIKGENTYRPPVEKKPEKPAAETLVCNFADLKTLIVSSAEITTVENGGQKISTAGQYGQIHYTLPKTIQLGDYEKVVITMSGTTNGVGIAARTAGGWGATSAGFWWNRQATGENITDVELRFDQLGYGWNGVLTEAEGEMDITEICVQACGNPTDFTIYRIVFVAKGDEVPPYGDDNTSTDQTVEPLTIKAGDCWYWSINGAEGVKGDENPAAADGSVSWPITGAYREFRLMLPTEEGYDLSKYTKVVVDFTTDNPINVRLWPVTDQQKNAYGYPAPIYEKEASGTVEFNLKTDSLYQAAYASDSYTDFDLKEFGFVLSVDNVTANVKVNSITLK